MSRAFCSLALALTVSVCAAPAHSLSPDLTVDIRCFVAAINLMQATPDSTARSAAFSSALYYLGRLDGRNPTLNLEELIVAESQKMTQSDIRSELQRCGKALSARGTVVTVIGQKLTQSNNQLSPKWRLGATLEKSAVPDLTSVTLGVVLLCIQALQSIRGGEDRDALMLAQIEQVFVAGDDELGLGGRCAGEHMVIVGIAGGGFDRGRAHVVAKAR